jgi:hypothetical protein
MDPLNTLQYFIYPKENKIDVYKDNIKIFSFYDSIEDVGSADFKRVIDNYTYYIKNNEIVLKIKILPTKFLSKLKIKNNYELEEDQNIITFDIETLLINNIHKPYLYSMYDGKETYS